MAVLTVSNVNRTGLDLASALVAADVAGDSFPNTGVEYIVFKNTNAATRVITMVLQATADGQAGTSKTYTIAATTGYAILGPFPTSIYNDTNNRMNFTYSAVTNLTVAVCKNTTS